MTSSDKIMVVDDEKVIRETLSAVLTQNSYEVVVAENGKIGLELYQKHHPQIIILDLDMPVINGIQFLEQVQLKPTDETAVIMLTGYDSRKNVKKCYELGVSGFLRKPFDTTELMGLVTQIIALKQAQCELAQQRDHLEKIVGERTAELQKKNEQLQEEIAERIRIEEDLIKAKKVAEESSEAKSNFLANISHEIRTPMNGIIGMTDLTLRTTELTDDQREYLQNVKTCADSLLGLINDLLDFSKIEAQEIGLDAIDFSLREPVENAASFLSLDAHKKGLDLTCYIEPDVPDALRGDAARVRQIIINLLDNAIKFTETGEININVEKVKGQEDLTQNASRVTIHFSIADTGIGIPEDKFEIIFERFTQVDATSTRQYGGTGLGLAYSKQLVQLMDGQIWVESKVGEGSTFHFTIKMMLNHENDKMAEVLDDIKGRSVFVIDDNDTNRQNLKKTLSMWGLDVGEAADGITGVTELEQAHKAGKPYQLVFLDVRMPDIGGFEVAELIREEPDLKDLKIVMLASTTRRQGDRSKFDKLDILTYLTKPVKISELFDSVMDALTDRQKEDSSIDAELPKYSQLDGLRVLLAEDNPVNQKLAIRMMEKRGCKVTAVEDGEEVLDALLKDDCFDLVLMDLQMSKMDGIETTEKIREVEKIMGGHLPIIVMTARTQEDKDRCLEAGMDDYISKPFQADQFFETISRWAKK